MSRGPGVASLAAAAGLAAGLLAWPVPARAAPTHVAIVIRDDKTVCVAWHSGITGDEVLNEVASVHYRNDGLIIQIDGIPDRPHADDTHFWAYWHDTGGGWRFSTLGASSYHPQPGTVEGWAYGNQAKPPALGYASICHDAAAAPPRRSTAPPHRPTGPAAAPAPPGPATSVAAAPQPGRGATPSTPRARATRPGQPRTSTPSRAAVPRGQASTVATPPVATPPPGTVSTVSVSPVSKGTAKHDSSPWPALGTALGLAAAAAVGGAAYWRVRRNGP
jgi:hypothetical protein